MILDLRAKDTFRTYKSPKRATQLCDLARYEAFQETYYLWTNRCHKVLSFSVICFLLPHLKQGVVSQLRQQPQRIN